MKTALSILMLIILFSCNSENDRPSQEGVVIFNSIELNSFNQENPNGRLEATSSWKHIFVDEATLIIKNKSTNQTYSLKYNPNSFTNPSTISLPYGSYEFESKVLGDKYSSHLPYQSIGNFDVTGAVTSITLNATTDYGLVTVKNQFLEAAWILDEGYKSLNYSDEREYFYSYVKGGINLKLEIIEYFNNTGFVREFEVKPYSHYNFRLDMSNGNVNFINLIFDPFQLYDFEFQIGENVVFDEDGNTYSTVNIGGNTWLKRSLRVKKFNNGDAIFQATSREQWKHAFDNKIPAWAYFKFDPSTEEQYGLAYNAFVVLDERGIAPRGFTLPAKEDFDQLVELYGGVDVAAIPLKNQSLWAEGNNGTNTSGFSANPSGYFNSDGTFNPFHFGTNATFWSKTKFEDTGLHYFFISSQDWVTVSIRNFGMGQQIRAVRPI